MADRWRLRIYEGKVVTSPGQPADTTETVVHAAIIVSNMEFAHTPCGKTAGAGAIYEAPRDASVTCVRCLAVMFANGDRWT